MTALYKVLGPQGESIHGGSGKWELPKINKGGSVRPGAWMPLIDRPLCCHKGYHLVELHSLTEWLRRDCTIYTAEGRGAESTDGDGKTAYAQARLLRQVHISEQDMRLFAADCAEHVLPIFYKMRPADRRPALAIEAARQFARGEIDDKARAAARAAAWAAAGDAAWAAARAAWDAARAAERQWQAITLRGYLS